MATISQVFKNRTPAPRFHLRLSEPQRTAIAFLAPALLIFSIFVLWPIIKSVRYSLYDWNGVGPLSDFIGVNNYEDLLHDKVFWKALKNNGIVVIWSLGTQIPLGVGLALLLTRGLKGSSFFRTLYFVPMVLSEVIVGVIWRWIYQPFFGMANAALLELGLDKQGWLGDEKQVLLCILVVATWRYLGFYIVIFIAAIQGIPEEYYEAASIDGANAFQRHRYITIPQLIPTIRVASVLMIVGALKSFDLVWVLSQGGPSHASELVATYMFKEAFSSNNWGYGSTIAFTLFLIAFVLAITFIFFTRQKKDT
ncbi:MAG: sugar ABC transporter permease [Chloroflexi bacterium]|nr:sugar ABC transporter permease [Chloroflexota bacterium]NOG65337.1 sugar ABC transporter permease [Chloroflexota bacterium]